MPYLDTSVLPGQPTPFSPLDDHERELRKKAVQKFIARAEISMVTRALRARLSYASYKAIHNVPHLPLRELEGQLLSQNQATSLNRSIAAKRKSAATSTGHYNNPSLSPSSASGAGASAARNRGAGNMAPPPSVTSPRTHHSAASGASPSAGNRSSTTSRRGSITGQTLYTSILAPSTQMARTVHNARDPPLPASSRPAPSPRVRTIKPSPKSATNSSRTHSKAKQPDKKNVASPSRRKNKRASLDKGKSKKQSHGLDADGDVDMKAAATLTSLLLNHRSSMHGTAHSPRSSMDGSETGSTSYSHYAQSSARSTTATSPPGSISSAVTMAGTGSSYRQQTPPPSQAGVNAQQTTPRPAPTDNEAADLMLFLATSPSPARPTPQPRDASTYRSLGGESSALRNKGRILFASSSAPDVMVHDDVVPAGSRPQPTLARGSDGTYSLSSGVGNETGSRDLHTSRASLSSTSITPSQLLPPPSLPASSRVTDSPMRKDVTQSPKTIFGSGGASDYNFNEFINASPSPLRGTPHGPGHKPNLSLRADVGRKLFEEEQSRHSYSLSLPHPSPAKARNGRGLDAGIDIMPTT
ncbi:hypothetical protein AGABI1DRAFT_129117 [Agaricus bisporus var. burnettii JB137-S8]|uniref:Uncharacterized protein n=1 Tax=Agaricus bisporus var. burnettii (strain JB137-S8 / ATCC MYA-4627 / FGSC 10392) TaxID=597362 RepID=K5X6K6_AGABU|nr:uncharacterized protein AGABI1DRAFT_129117 [Agaricus bisporus var. burnettii JB137-S8]EKM78838.1 hypothetical protein AGABI1DRAFT_129117 [Agaricus bisporus var. burnettii JB137-S8]